MGYATIAKGSHINPAAFGFNEKLEHYPYDIEKARALIKEAGAEANPRGRRRIRPLLKDREQIEAVAG